MRERNQECHCTSCDKLIGKQIGARFHMRYSDRIDAIVAFPVHTRCPRCKALNVIIDDGTASATN